MRLTVIGSGDAFGSGGRLQTCFHVDAGDTIFLVDCGASALIGMHREGLDPNAVDTIFISHLHGDHFSGLVWWKIHAHHTIRRTRPLTIAGPVGLKARFDQACEVLFPGSSRVEPRFETTYVEFEAEAPIDVGGTRLTAFTGKHPSGALSAALRLERAGKVLSYSGDTEWVDGLVPCATGADLFITECYSFDEVKIPYHLNWQVLSAKLDELAAKKVMLTHMNLNMLANTERVAREDVLIAHDGRIIEL